MAADEILEALSTSTELFPDETEETTTGSAVVTAELPLDEP